MTRPQIGNFLCVGNLVATLVSHDRARVTLVFGCRIEGQAAHRILDAKKILEIEWDKIRRRNQEQVVRKDLRIGIAGRDVMAPIPVTDLLAFLVIKHLEAITGLFRAQLDQGIHCVAKALGCILMKDDSPSGVLQFGRVYIEGHPERPGRFQMGDPEGSGTGLSEHLLCKVVDRPRCEGVVSGLDVYSVDVNKVGIGGHRSSSSALIPRPNKTISFSKQHNCNEVRLGPSNTMPLKIMSELPLRRRHPPPSAGSTMLA